VPRLHKNRNSFIVDDDEPVAKFDLDKIRSDEKFGGALKSGGSFHLTLHKTQQNNGT